MAQTIKLKRSSTGGAVPSTSSLSLGEVAINTYDGKMYIKKNDGTDSIVQIGAGSGSAVWNSYDYTATSSQTSFSGNDNNSESLSYVPGFLQVFLNGILLDPAVDYAATTGSSIVLTVGATTSDLVQIETFTQIIGTGDILVDTFPVSSTQTAFTLSQDPINKSNISVYVEGVYQESSTYSLSTTTLTLSESPANGTTVEVVIGTRNVTLDNIADLTISGTLHAGALDLGDANIINVNEISLDTIKGDADANTNITFAGSDVTTFTQGGQERLRLNTTGAQVTGNIVVSGTVDGRDVAADGVTADAALSRAGGAMGGAITTNSTFDGRDVSVDGTKLDGIESGATADQTDVEIRAAVESASDSNVFTNADHSKLDAIEASATADQTQTEINALGITATGLSGTPNISVGTISSGAITSSGTGSFTGGGNTLSIAKGSGTPALAFLGTATDPQTSALIEGIAGGGLKFYTSTGTLSSPSWSPKITLAANGNTTFAGTISSGAITSSGTVKAYGNSDTVAALEIYSNSTHGMRILHRGTDGDFSFERRVNGTNTEFLRIGRGNGNATFAGTISSGAITSTGDIEVRSGNKLILQRPNNAVASIISTDSTGAMILDSLNSEGFFFNNNGTNIFKLDPVNATFAGAITAGDNIVIGSGGTYQAGNIYSDSSWGMILRAKQANPSQADFLFSDSADNHLVRFDGSYGLRIQTGGLQIGTTTVIDANRRILAADGAVNVPYITFAADTDTGLYRPAANTLAVSTGGSERLRIGSTGIIYVNGDATGGRLSGDGSGGLVLQDGNGRQSFKIMSPSSGSVQAMTLDANSNFLVGTTNTTWQSQEGLRYFNGSSLIITRDSDEPMNLNRLTSDGDLLILRKDGAAVGSIGTNSGYMVIGSPVGTDAHLLIGNGLIHPATSTGSTKDAAIDLGGSSNRFKDLYITGLDVTYSTYNKISSYFSGTYTSGFKFSDMNGGIWYDAGTDDLTVSAGHANSKLILASGGSTALTLLSDQSAIFAGTISSGAIASTGVIAAGTNATVFTSSDRAYFVAGTSDSSNQHLYLGSYHGSTLKELTFSGSNNALYPQTSGGIHLGLSSKKFGNLELNGSANIGGALGVTGAVTGTSFSDGYVTWTAAQFNRSGAAIEFQFTPTNANWKVKIGANGDNPTEFNAYTGDADFSGEVSTPSAKLKAIAESNTDTAVDVFVYDTRKDSDGGAWRKRTQNTSWYNEALNTSTRGARKEFPSVAVIVVASNDVTIYDGDDPDMPLWMKFSLQSSLAVIGVNIIGLGHAAFKLSCF